MRLRFGAHLRRYESSADVVQSVCAEVLDHRASFRHGGGEGLRRWLFRTALRKIADRHAFWNAARRSPEQEERALDAAQAEELVGAYRSVCTPSRDASAREEVARIEAAFDRLSPRHREVLVDARILQRDRGEMAAERGLDRTALRQLLARATAALADQLVEGA